jgi:Fe-S-cluster containining protein
MLVYIGWCPPSKGGWAERGNHEYRCIHFDREQRRCLIYDQPRPLMCTGYPEYNNGLQCENEDCTRRTEPAPEEAMRIMRGVG